MSKVFFADMRCPVGTSLLHKLEKLLDKAGFAQLPFTKRYAAIKIHFGEPGNLSALRPHYAKVVADKITALGGRPFLTDCSTLYVGRRSNALDHLESAWENGYSFLSCGCPILMGDGLKGTDDVEVPVPGGKLLKTALIGRTVMDADIVVSLNHFKGHECTGFGGALKNLGMGCGSRAGKMAMHSDGKPQVNPRLCTGCRFCAKHCAHCAISFGTDGKARIDHTKCVGCGRCIGVCSFHAIDSGSFNANDALNQKIAEYTAAVLAGKPHFHISVAAQISPYCDCHGDNDAAVVPDIGIFASSDPVALDHACIDAVNAAPALYSDGQSGDHFGNIHPGTNWRTQLEHAEAIGLGEQKYEIVRV
ncbi:MAG: DUF362 domain-containing protein [Oscillospiraceae bacterium]|jgi:uncharacterized Fe-S center protein|nr:DUF362 domain-containing protein [Oscillospiraceae bacterium]